MQASLYIAASPPVLVADLLTRQPLVLNLSSSSTSNGTLDGPFRCVIAVSGKVATVQLSPTALGSGASHLVFAAGDGWGDFNMDFQVRPIPFLRCSEHLNRAHGLGCSGPWTLFWFRAKPRPTRFSTSM